ncbi:MAG: hypothetical protein IPI72_09035 [Flavobacteriales bacterium]|nr:hypothetical protein [Flavobacteriales bacterium]
MVKRMMDAVEGKSFKFNKLTTIVKPLSSYVTVGGTYQAEIFPGAYDDQNAPEVYIAGPGATVDTIGKRSSVRPSSWTWSVPRPVEATGFCCRTA